MFTKYAVFLLWVHKTTAIFAQMAFAVLSKPAPSKDVSPTDRRKDLRWVNRKLNKILSLSKGKWIVLTNFRVVCGVVTNKLNVTEYS